MLAFLVTDRSTEEANLHVLRSSFPVLPGSSPRFHPGPGWKTMTRLLTSSLVFPHQKTDGLPGDDEALACHLA